MQIDNNTTIIILVVVLALLIIWYFKDKHVPKINLNEHHINSNVEPVAPAPAYNPIINTESVSIGSRTSSHTSALIAAPFNKTIF